MKKHFNKNLFMTEKEEENFRSRNVNLKLTKKVPVIFHNVQGYDSHLIINEIGKFDAKADVIPNGLEKCMTFTINKNLIFIKSIHFMNSSLEN